MFSKIGKGFKHFKKSLTLKKVLPVAGVAAALAIPGVGGAVVGGISAAGRAIGRGGLAAGRIAKTGLTAAEEAAQGVAGGISEAADQAVESGGSFAKSRDQILAAIKRGSTAVANFQASGKEAATEGAVAGVLQSVPSYVWIGAAALVVFLMVRRK